MLMHTCQISLTDITRLAAGLLFQARMGIKETALKQATFLFHLSIPTKS